VTSWQDVAFKGLEFLQNANIRAIIILVLFFAFLAWVLPMAAMAYVTYDNTNRVVAAIHDMAMNCQHSVAMKPHL
jgi:hypothetical protein